jgi:hypothetical protein
MHQRKMLEETICCSGQISGRVVARKCTELDGVHEDKKTRQWGDLEGLPSHLTSLKADDQLECGIYFVHGAVQMRLCMHPMASHGCVACF